MGQPATLDSLQSEVAALRALVEGLVAQQQPMVDLRAAAKHLGVSTRTLRRKVERQEVPFRRVGRTLRFNLALLGPRTT